MAWECPVRLCLSSLIESKFCHEIYSDYLRISTPEVSSEMQIEHDAASEAGTSRPKRSLIQILLLLYQSVPKEK